MELFQEQSFPCPYCGSPNHLAIEYHQRDNRFVVDCEICCRPIEISVTQSGQGRAEINVRKENE